MIQTYYALNNQTLYDVCLVTYGSLDQLFKLMQDNGLGSINNYPAQGQAFVWDDTLVFNEQVMISNQAAGVQYATRASDVGNLLYNIQGNGLPVSGSPIVSPVAPGSGTGSALYDYYLVYNTDVRWSSNAEGQPVFTDAYLQGKSGYAVYAQQLAQFFNVNQDTDLHYDSITGSFTLLMPGFSLINQYYLVIYPNKYNTSIP